MTDKDDEISPEDFIKYLDEEELNNLKPFISKEEFDNALTKLEDDFACKHCGRCVLAGPPCCYELVYEMYQQLYSEVQWHRKIQSKKDKRINELEKEIENLKKLLWNSV